MQADATFGARGRRSGPDRCAGEEAAGLKASATVSRLRGSGLERRLPIPMFGLQLGFASDAILGSSFGAINAFLLFDDKKVPNEEALALSPTVGWLLLVGAVAFAILMILYRDAWRRWWLTAEDPRALALYRIVFGLCVIANMNDFFEYFTFLFTDEGLFTADVARQVHAAHQFEGFGDGFSDDDPWGFFDLRAVLRFLEGPKYSLLYIWDSPAFMWGHMIAFYVCAISFVVGFRTRLSGILTFFLMNSIFFRNHLFWEGTELVYRVFLAYLICAKSGYAFSVDNWLRCRKLRRKGELSVRGGPGNGAGVAPSAEVPRGLQAIYRLIPAWPRRLAILQLGVVYLVTGVLKNGNVWARGDAIYYAWSMDHFYRFYPQPITAVIGTNLLRVMSWSTHWGESLFVLCVLGMIVKWSIRERIPALRGASAVVMQLCWLTIIGIASASIWVTWPVHFAPRNLRVPFMIGWVAGCLGLWWLWRRLGQRPFEVKGRVGLWLVWGSVIALINLFLWLLLFPLVNGRAALAPSIVLQKVGIMWAWTTVAVALPFVVRRVPVLLNQVRKIPIFRPEFLSSVHVVDRRWMGAWPLGRRIWIPWHISLMLGIFMLMNIGQFQTGMLAQSLVFLYGAEAALIIQWVLARAKLTPYETPIPAEDPTLPHLRRDAAEVPAWALYTGLAIIVAGIVVRVVLHPNPQWEWRWIWVGAFVIMGFAAWRSARATRGISLSTIHPDTDRPRIPWAYGPFGRFMISSLLVWHVSAVTIWLLPEKDSLGKWRGTAREVFTKWLTTTQTDQGWGMFAPNPPRSNVFLKVLVTVEDGEVYDLKTDVYAAERKPIPWIWNDRMRKMNRRIIGGESGNSEWYRKWYARYICRDWGMSHDGIEPKKVDLVKVWYRIPSPEETYEKGWYSPEDLLERAGAEKIEHTEYCRNTVMGQIPPWVRERHGMPELREGWKYRPWLKHKKKKWDQIMKKSQEGDAKKETPPAPKRATPSSKGPVAPVPPRKE